MHFIIINLLKMLVYRIWEIPQLFVSIGVCDIIVPSYGFIGSRNILFWQSFLHWLFRQNAPILLVSLEIGKFCHIWYECLYINICVYNVSEPFLSNCILLNIEGKHLSNFFRKNDISSKNVSSAVTFALIFN